MTDDLVARLRLEARCHAYEARSANATINEIYQIVSGGRGEPGNWHGAEPVRRYVEAAEARVRELEAMVSALNGDVHELGSRLSTIEAETIEQCARKVEGFANDPLKSWILDVGAASYVAAAIRQLAQVKHEAE